MKKKTKFFILFFLLLAVPDLNAQVDERKQQVEQIERHILEIQERLDDLKRQLDGLENVEREIKEIKICSFNIKWLGHYKRKKNQALVSLLKEYDIVLIQELVSPPHKGSYPDGSEFESDKEAKEFTDLMLTNGFEYWISEEDTGPNKIHTSGAASEWFIVFYSPDKLSIRRNGLNGFLANNRLSNPDYERVPYAFSFKVNDGGMDFVLISVHLKPGSSRENRARRIHEIGSVYDWILENDSEEKDFIILGDMNIHDCRELSSVLPAGYSSINANCKATNLSSEGKPYDHGFYHTEYSTEVDLSSFRVLDLKDEMLSIWDGIGVFPEDNLGLFSQYYSDHKPIIFTLKDTEKDDD